MTRSLLNISVFLAGSSLLLGACASNRTADAAGRGSQTAPGSETTAASDAPLQGREAILTVFGMSCPLCANNVDKSLLEVPGVTGVTVDMSTGKARVTLDGKTPVTRAQLARAVDRSGFTLQSIETP